MHWGPGLKVQTVTSFESNFSLSSRSHSSFSSTIHTQPWGHWGPGLKVQTVTPYAPNTHYLLNLQIYLITMTHQLMDPNPAPRPNMIILSLGKHLSHPRPHTPPSKCYFLSSFTVVLLTSQLVPRALWQLRFTQLTARWLLNGRTRFLFVCYFCNMRAHARDSGVRA